MGRTNLSRQNKSLPPAANGASLPSAALSREMVKLSNRTDALFLEYYIRFQILSTLNGQMDVEHTLNVVKKLLRKNFPVAQYALLLLSARGDELTLRSHFGLPRREAANGRYQLDDHIFGAVLKRGQPLYVPSLEQAPASHADHLRPRRRQGALLALPLITPSSRVIGVLNLFRRRPHSFAAKEMELLRKIAGQLAQVLDTMAIYHQTREQSITDELTRVFNRRYFNQRFEREMQRAQRYQRSLSLIMLDIDHFKIFNDTHGHLWGDAVLKQVAQTLEGSLRKADILARFGGEEFVILLPEIDRVHGQQVAEKLRQAIANTTFPKAETQPFGRLTVSLGLASFPEDAAEAEHLIHAADQGLYHAKTSGRNRVGLYAPKRKSRRQKIAKPAD